MSDLFGLLRSSARDFAAGWLAFLFQPADPTPLGLIRVGVGALALWSMLTLGFDLHDYLGTYGWADPAVTRALLPEGGWSFWFWVPDSLLVAVWWVCLLVLICFTLGLWSRYTAVLAWVIIVATARRAPLMVHGFENILSAWLFYLAITGTSGQAVSLDRFFSRWKKSRSELANRRSDGRWVLSGGVPSPTISANLALRLIQLHLAIIYGVAGLTKLRGDVWWNGSALAMILVTPEFRRFDLAWLVADYPLLIQFATHAGVAIEVGYPFLIWNRKLRPWLLIAVTMMHLGIELALGLGEFGLVMLAGNLSFVSGTWLRSLVAGKSQPAGKVLYDGHCPRCRATMAILAAGDPDHVIEPVDLNAVDVTKLHPKLTKEAALARMHVVRSDGKVYAGYDAVMVLLSWIPLTWLGSLVRFVPGVAWIGRRVYDVIANSRPRDVPCTDKVCGIHPPAASTRKVQTSVQDRVGRSR